MLYTIPTLILALIAIFVLLICLLGVIVLLAAMLQRRHSDNKNQPEIRYNQEIPPKSDATTPPVLQ